MSSSASGSSGGGKMSQMSTTIQTMLLNKTLSSMVKGIRQHKAESGGSKTAEAEYIAKCIAEIKEELKTNFMDVKSVAIQKLIYLQMLGYDMSWAAFHVIELMSASWFGHKRIGYLAASVSFTKDTDVILLTTHLFRKGFNTAQTGGPSSNATINVEGFQYETGAAISCLANIVTADLAEGLLSDVYALMNSSRPYIRKKAVLVLLKIFKAWPKALRLSFDRLKEKLDDENQGVVSAAVYVICELAAKNPKNYLSLAPQFFKILTTSSNNWVLIKVVKLLGSLVPLEPRLAKKLTEPLCDIISTTPAKSLLYESVNTLLCGELRSKTVVRLCLEKLRGFIEDPDQNLKYLGLLGLHKLLQKQPRVVSEHKDLILDCLHDEDVTIRMRALDLLTSMVSLRNLPSIVTKLLDHLAAAEGSGSYREHVLDRILFICSQDNFAYLADFEWYVSILVDLTHIHGVSRDNAHKIKQQFLEVVMRVPAIRNYTCKQMTNILLADRLGMKNGDGNGASGSMTAGALASLSDGRNSVSTLSDPSTAPQGHMSEVLYAVAFILGEYTDSYLESQDDSVYESLILHLTKWSSVKHLPLSVQSVFVHAAIKILSAAMLQPFDNAGVKDILSTAQVKELGDRGMGIGGDMDGSIMGGQDDLLPDVSAQQANDRAEEVVGSEEEDDFDSYGLRKRKHASLKRSFVAWHDWIARLLSMLYNQLPLFSRADSMEVQERAVVYLQLVKWIITQGQFESKISGWSTGTGTGVNVNTSVTALPDMLSPTKNLEKSVASPSTPNAQGSAPPAATTTTPIRELNLLSLDPLEEANKQELSIFDAPSTTTDSNNNASVATPAASTATPPASSTSPPPSISSTTPSSSATSLASNTQLKSHIRSLAQQFGLLFAERLNPVNPKAQRKVPVPKGLDLSVEINTNGATQDIAAGEKNKDGEGSEEESDYESYKPRRKRGALYDDEDESSLGGGFGSKKSSSSSSTRRGGGRTGPSLAAQAFDDDSFDKKRMSAEEKEEARQRAERRRQQQMNDPYYLKEKSSSSSSATAPNMLDVNDIPVRQLEDADLPGLKVEKEDKHSLPRISRKGPTKAFKVLRDDDMPKAGDSSEEDLGVEGASSSSRRSKSSRHKKEKDRHSRHSRRKSSGGAGGVGGETGGDILDIDLTTPLGADEIMPRVKSYAETQAEKEKEREAARAHEKGDRKHRTREKDRHGDRDRDRHHHRERDHDRKDKKRSKESDSSSSKKEDAPKSATAATASLFDLFDPMGTPPAASSSSNKPSSSSSSSSAPSAASASASASASSVSPLSSSDLRYRDRTVFKDSTVRIRSVAQLMNGGAGSSSTVLITVDATLDADNPKKVGAIPKMTLEVKCGKYVERFSAESSSRCKVSDKGIMITMREISAGSTGAVRGSFIAHLPASTSLDRPYTLSARVSYTTDKGRGGKDDESCAIELPLSTFIQPKKLSATEMASAMLNASKPPKSLASTTLNLKKNKVNEAIRAITPALNVALVEAVAFTATYFGIMAANQTYVAVLVKARKGDDSSLSVEVKTTSSKYSEELLDEIKRKLK